MKKSIVILIAVAMTLASCSVYTCPTYSKAPQKKTSAEVKI